MGKKAKGKGKGKSKGNKKATKDASATESIKPLSNIERSEEEKQLAMDCRKLKAQYSTEERALNAFQQSVVKIESELIMSKQKAYEVKSQMRDALLNKESIADTHEYEAKTYQSKVKHLLFENGLQITDLRIECEEILKALEGMDRAEQHSLRMNVRSLLRAQKENTLKHAQLLNEYQRLSNQCTYALREEYKIKIRNLYSKYSEKFAQTRVRHVREARAPQIRVIEQRKNKHIHSLMRTHKQSLTDIKSYYSDIIHSNLDLIKSLKSEIIEITKKEKLKESQMIEISNVNKSLSKPLKLYLSDIETLKSTLKCYAKDRKVLTQTQASIDALRSEYESLQWKQEILTQKYAQKSAELAVLKQTYEETLLDRKQKTDLRTLLVQQSINQMSSDIEKQSINFNEILGSIDKNQNKHKLDDIIKVKDNTIKHIETKSANLKQKYQNMCHYYQQLMLKYNIPKN